MKKKLLIIGQAAVTKAALSLLETSFSVFRIPALGRLSDNPDLDSFDVVWIHVDTTVTDECAERLSDHAILATTSTGLTHISNRAQLKLSGRLISLRGEEEFLSKITSTAELSWALLLASLTNLAQSSNSVLAGSWCRSDHIRSAQVSSTKVGIVGFGRLGEMSARIGLAIAKEIAVFDIDKTKNEKARLLGYSTFDSIDELANHADAILIHASVTHGQTPVISRDLLAKHRHLRAIVNTSRGIAVDEDAVVSALKSGFLGFYCADVLSCEDNGSSLQDSNIWREFKAGGRVLLTPHIGGASQDAIDQVELLLAEKILTIRM